MKHCLLNSIITHICAILKDSIAGSLFGNSWGKGFRQLIDIGMATNI